MPASGIAQADGVSMPYWAAARAQPNREAAAQHFLQLAGYTVYLPRLRQHRVSHGRKIETRPPLFPGYLFIEIVVGWWQARWCPATLGLVMNCDGPARVPDDVIAEIRSRESDGLVELPSRLRRGDRVRVTAGPLAGRLGLFEGMAGSERVSVLLRLFNGPRRLELPRQDVEPA
jgi:transcription antitermination factor NusG